MTGNDFEVIGTYAQNYLDEVLVHESVYSQFLQDNRAIDESFYERGWVRLLSVLVDGLGFYRITNEQNVIVTANAEEYADYNGNVSEGNRAGYPINGVTSKWTLYRVRFDRATQFKMDEVDLSLSGLNRMLAPTMDEFYRTRLIPEVDATYTSIIADCTKTSLGNRVLENPTEANAVNALLRGEGWLFNHGVSANDTVILMRWSFYQLLLGSSQWTRYFAVNDYRVNDEVSLRLNFFNGKPIFLLPDDRAFTDVALTKNGYTTSGTSRYINFMFVSKEYLYPIKRINRMRTYDQSVITSFDGLIINFHLWHDLIVPMNKKVSVYASINNGGDNSGLIGANKNVLEVSSIKGEDSGTTIINALFTEPKGLNYNKVYVKATAFGEIGTTQSGGTLVEVGSPFTPAAASMFVAVTDGSGTIVAKTEAAVAFEVQE